MRPLAGVCCGIEQLKHHNGADKPFQGLNGKGTGLR